MGADYIADENGEFEIDIQKGNVFHKIIITNLAPGEGIYAVENEIPELDDDEGDECIIRGYER
jgi:hypothetical protein